MTNPRLNRGLRRLIGLPEDDSKCPFASVVRVRFEQGRPPLESDVRILSVGSTKTQLASSLTKELGQVSDMLFACVKIHEVEPEPQTPAVVHSRKPRFASRHHTTCEVFLKSIADL